jgi:glycosyltransferase involved in cell wall biosynthesis
MNPKQASVIIPAYNAALYIRQAIESVLAQTYRDYEIIVVDDGSTDDTPRIAQQFGSAIRYIRQDNMGLSAARNTGIKNSQAAVIALLDADDLWEPEFLEVMLSFLNKHPQAAGAYCGFQYINSRGEIVGQPSIKVVPPEEFYENQVFIGNWLAPCAVIFHKHLAEQVGLFDESLRAVEDADLWIRLSALRPFVGFPKALVRYRRHDSNMTKDPQRMVTAEYQVTQKIFGPAEGDRLSWPRPKVDAYISHFRSAAVRYMEAGNISKSATYLRELFLLSSDYVASIELWRGLARAHIPQEHRYSSALDLNWTKLCADFEHLLEEFAAESNSPGSPNGQYSRIKGAAFLALADEAGRNYELQRALEWLWKAVQCNPQIVFSRPYWGTIFRSLANKVSG